MRFEILTIRRWTAKKKGMQRSIYKYYTIFKLLIQLSFVIFESKTVCNSTCVSYLQSLSALT